MVIINNLLIIANYNLMDSKQMREREIYRIVLVVRTQKERVSCSSEGANTEEPWQQSEKGSRKLPERLAVTYTSALGVSIPTSQRRKLWLGV